MINAGKAAISELPDGWTIITRDRSLSAQWEHTVLVTENGVEVLSLSAACPLPPQLITGTLAKSTVSTIAALPPAPVHALQR